MTLEELTLGSRLVIGGIFILLLGSLHLFLAGREIFMSMMRTQRALLTMSANNPLSLENFPQEEFEGLAKKAIETLYSEYSNNESIRNRVKRNVIFGLSLVAIGSFMQAAGTVFLEGDVQKCHIAPAQQGAQADVHAFGVAAA